MDENTRFGLGVTGLICSIGYVIGDICGLIASIAFCTIPWIYELRNRNKNEEFEVVTCKLCGSKFRLRNKIMVWEYETIGLCPLCINKIFQYTKRVPES